MDTALFKLINDSMRCPLLDQLMPVLSDKDFVVLPGLMALIVLFYFGGRYVRTCMLVLLIGLALSDTGSEKVIKNLVQQNRPYGDVELVHLHRNGEWTEYQSVWYAHDPRRSFGFPSSHASNMAMIAVVLAFLSRRTLWVTVPLALLVGLSRIYTGNHYPSQVLAGYAWGSLCAFVSINLCFWAVRRIWGQASEIEAPRPSPPRERVLFYWLLGGWTAMNFIYVHLNLFDLAGDEAQYWDWSRRLALGYYSKPPMIAYVMHLFTSAGGNQEWSLRTGAILFTSGALALVYALTLRIARNERAALIAAVSAIAMPASWAGSVIMTIDPVLLFFWALAMYAFHRAIKGDWGMWALTGFALGLGLLSKYTMALLMVSFALHLLVAERKLLRTRGPYIALLISLLCLSGVLYWNYEHDWVSFRHTASIGAGEGAKASHLLQRIGEFWGAQAGIVSPLLFGFFFWAWWWCLRCFRQNTDAVYLVLCGGALFVFYALVALVRDPEPNWPIAAYLSAAIALGWAWTSQPRGGHARKWLAAALILGCLIGVIGRSTDALYALGRAPQPSEREDRIYIGPLRINPDMDPTDKMRGGREIGQALEGLAGDSKNGPFLFSDRYQLTAWLSYYTSGRPKAYCFPYERRQNQYDLWGGWEKLKGRDALFVTGGGLEKAQLWIDGLVELNVFERGECLKTVEVRRGHTLLKTYTISRLYRYAGFKLTPQAEF